MKKVPDPAGKNQRITERPKIYRKSVLHLLNYKFAVNLSRCSTDLSYILGQMQICSSRLSFSFPIVRLTRPYGILHNTYVPL